MGAENIGDKTTTGGGNGTPEECLAEGVYEYQDSYNFDAYLTELGVSWYLRKLASYAKPIVTIKKLKNFDR